ncbi:TspO/MBR family protein [Lacrimispora sp. JR3]|uniref:TspO/MBR family protein n=1 Tax=Lacrimispora sinapis TaxID=3111456 RepID=UPI00374A0A4F
MSANRKKLLAYILFPLIVGAISGFLSRNGMNMYSSLNRPPLSPPGWVFPLVWTILYILMGISSYLIASSPSPKKREALLLYAVQLFLNFIWSPIFFGLKNYLLAFIVLLLLWYAIFKMIRSFFQVDSTAALLQIPYLLWVAFAGYLNLAIVFIN